MSSLLLVINHHVLLKTRTLHKYSELITIRQSVCQLHLQNNVLKT